MVGAPSSSPVPQDVSLTQHADIESVSTTNGYQPLRMDSLQLRSSGRARVTVFGFVVLGCAAAAVLLCNVPWSHTIVGSEAPLDRSDLEALEKLHIDVGKLRALVGNSSSMVAGSNVLPGDWENQLKNNLKQARHNGQLTTAMTAAMTRLAPKDNNRHDGNPCENDEEVYNHLCYKKCSELTGGKYDLRTSAWTCCEKSPCVFHQRSDMGFCSGFSVSGGSDGLCPHAPGACLANEELYGGQCFKQCTILTNGAYTHRIASSSCCKHTGLACLLPHNYQNHPALAVGGGVGDGHQSTPSQAHPPLLALAES